MKTIILFTLLVLSSKTFSINYDIREAKIKNINELYVRGIAKATKLKDSQVREFLPGNKNYGKSISDVYKLNLDQKRAINQYEKKRKNAMFELRKTFGVPKKNETGKPKVLRPHLK